MREQEAAFGFFFFLVCLFFLTCQASILRAEPSFFPGTCFPILSSFHSSVGQLSFSDIEHTLVQVICRNMIEGRVGQTPHKIQ